MPTEQAKRNVTPDPEAKQTISSLIRLAATPLAVIGWLATTLPSTAQSFPTSDAFSSSFLAPSRSGEVTIPTSYRNQFRGCAGRLLGVGISSSAAATACAGALSPRDLSRCVVRIKERTTIPVEEALSTCREVRRPNELASCVVGISRNNEEQAVPGVLNYCGRSLLPVSFAACVVGLRRESSDIAPTQALESCISATDQLPPREFAPTFVPQNGTPPIQPNLSPGLPQDQTTPNQSDPTSLPQTQPTPTQLAPAPLRQNETTPNQSAPAPLPQNQTTPNQPAPAPATP